MRADIASAARHRAANGVSSHASNVSVATLTDRECAVLDLLCTGHSNALIADNLGISIHTVKTHLRSAYVKLGVSSRLEVQAVLLSV